MHLGLTCSSSINGIGLVGYGLASINGGDMAGKRSKFELAQMVAFGQALKTARSKKGLSPESLATMAGGSNKTIRRLDGNTRLEKVAQAKILDGTIRMPWPPRTGVIVRLADALGVDRAEWLILAGCDDLPAASWPASTAISDKRLGMVLRLAGLTEKEAVLIEGNKSIAEFVVRQTREAIRRLQTAFDGPQESK